MAWRGFPTTKLDTAYLGQPMASLSKRDGRAVLGFHAVHEVEHVAFGLTGEAVEEAFGEVNTTTWPCILVEGAVHLGLVALAVLRR